MVISLPSVKEQRRITDILDAANDSIQSAELELAKRQTLADATMRSLLNSIDSTEMVSVGDCYSITSGLTLGPYRQTLTRTAPYLRVANVQRGFVDLREITVTGIQQVERDRYSLRAGDLLVVEGHADPDQIGRCARLNDDTRGFLYQNHLFRLRSPDIAPEFGLAWLNSGTARTYWRANCATSSGLYTITGSLLAEMPMPLVTGEDQEQVAALARTSDEAVEIAASTLRKLRMVKKGLIDDLLTGKVRVGKLSG
jgi:restriction endonuclease S subunit